MEIEGFVEEVNEPDEFWFVNIDGKVCPSSWHKWSNEVAQEFRFRTKESAEKFAKALKDSHEVAMIDFNSVIVSALNDRVK